LIVDHLPFTASINAKPLFDSGGYLLFPLAFLVEIIPRTGREITERIFRVRMSIQEAEMA
jgi:hypothetical protein